LAPLPEPALVGSIGTSDVSDPIQVAPNFGRDEFGTFLGEVVSCVIDYFDAHVRGVRRGVT
jgi:hypothetical protein